MSCTDPICIELKTCKWDMPVASTYCEATWYPQEKEPEVREIIKEVEVEVPVEVQRPKPQPQRRWSEQYYGRPNSTRER